MGAPESLVVDADCLIAGVLTSEGATSQLIDSWQEGGFELVACPRLVYEVRKALTSPRLAERYDISIADADAFARRLNEEGLMMDDPEDPPRAVPDDPGDDYLVALARASNSGFLVTRDRHFEKVDVDDLRIITPRDALSLIS
ncbi:MAG: PIN domain-containing protein [Actinomycetota bacterium]